tara:strand:+ start:5326 stop:5901 length:576 start_codon:yes stop_codon:yes gene_type:complete
MKMHTQLNQLIPYPNALILFVYIDSISDKQGSVALTSRQIKLELGLTRQQYRTALNILGDYGVVTTSLQPGINQVVTRLLRLKLEKITRSGAGSSLVVHSPEKIIYMSSEDKVVTVKLKKAEYDKLVEAHGQEKTEDCIQILFNYKASKGKGYKSDYHAILNWTLKRWEADNGFNLSYKDQQVKSFLKAVQ